MVEAYSVSITRNDFTVYDPETENLLNPPFDAEELYLISIGDYLLKC